MRNKQPTKLVFLILVVWLTTAATTLESATSDGQTVEPNPTKNDTLSAVLKQPTTLTTNFLLLPLQNKVDGKINEAMVMINEIVQSTNDSIGEYFETRQKRVGELYARMLSEIDQEKTGATLLLDKMVANSQETVVNLKHYFAEVMDLTMEKTYADIKTILSNAVSKIDSVSRNIKENLRANKDDLRVNHNLVDSQKSLSKLINSGVESIQRLAHKFKSETVTPADLSKHPKWEPLFRTVVLPGTTTTTKQTTAAASNRFEESSKPLNARRSKQLRKQATSQRVTQDQLEESWRREQELEAKGYNEALGEAEKKVTALAGKLAVTSGRSSSSSSLSSAESTDVSSTLPQQTGKTEKIVMTKRRKTNRN